MRTPSKCKTPECRNICKDRATCRTCARRAQLQGIKIEEKPTVLDAGSVSENMSGERTLTKTVNERVDSLEDLIRVFSIDTTVWEIVEWEAKYSEMGSIPRAVRDSAEDKWVRPSTTPVVTILCHVRAKMRPRLLVIAAKNEIEELKELAAQQIAQARSFDILPLASYPSSGNMLELDLFDIHLGKLAWGKETGYQNYDLRLAKAEFETALTKLIDRTCHYQFDEIIFPIGNDFFHADNMISETTHGTRQDTDGRFHKSARIGREMIVWATDRLREVAPLVTLIVVPGNHDQLSAWWLGDSLQCWYREYVDVEVKNAPTLRKYHEFGNVMLMFTHGNRGKLQDYPNLMATEQPEMWGRTKYREIHIGHFHKTQVQSKPSVNENHGVRTRILSALCAADAWHSEMQYVGNLRAAEAFVWNKDEGLLAQATYITPSEN